MNGENANCSICKQLVDNVHLPYDYCMYFFTVLKKTYNTSNNSTIAVLKSVKYT